MTFDPDWPHGHIYDGLPARVICTNVCGGHPILALVKANDGTEFARFFKLSGECLTSSYNRIHNAPAPKRKLECWVNVYPSGSFGSWPSRKLADSFATHDRIACKHIIVEEGEGLESQNTKPW